MRLGSACAGRLALARNLHLFERGFECGVSVFDLAFAFAPNVPLFFGVGRKIEHIDNGVIVLPPKKPLTERIGLLVPRVFELIETYEPDRAAAEQIIYVRNVRAAVALAARPHLDKCCP